MLTTAGMFLASDGPSSIENQKTVRCLTAVEDARQYKCMANTSDQRTGVVVARHLEHECPDVFHSRIVGPYDAVTEDLRLDRFTIATDAGGKCTGIEQR